MPNLNYILDLQNSNKKTPSPLGVTNKGAVNGTHYSHWGIGGYVELPSIEYRNAIPSTDGISEDLFSSGRRKFGMVVYVISENKYYQLIPREINKIDPTKPGAPVSLKKWLFYRSAKKTILLNPEKQGLDDFDDGTVVDELGEFGAVGGFDLATSDVISGSGDPNHCWTEVFVKGNFNNATDLQNYVDSNPAAYAGQICSVIDGNKLYLIASDMTLVEFTGGGGGSGGIANDLLDTDLKVLGVSIGSYNDGFTIPKDTPLETIIKNMLQKTIAPVYAQPVFSIGTSNTLAYEVGTSITPTITGFWDQKNAGPLIAYNLYKNSSPVLGPSSNTPLDAFVSSPFTLDSNTVYSGTVTWSDGSILNDNMGNPHPGGKIPNNLSNPKASNSITFIPKRALFYTADTGTSAPTSSSQIRALTSRIDIGNGSTFTILVGTNVKRIVIAYLKSYGAIASVVDSGIGYDIKNAFVLSELQVEGANGYTSETYYVYTSILGKNYPTAVTYTVTI